MGARGWKKEEEGGVFIHFMPCVHARECVEVLAFSGHIGAGAMLSRCVRASPLLDCIAATGDPHVRLLLGGCWASVGMAGTRPWPFVRFVPSAQYLGITTYSWDACLTC